MIPGTWQQVSIAALIIFLGVGSIICFAIPGRWGSRRKEVLPPPDRAVLRNQPGAVTDGLEVRYDYPDWRREEISRKYWEPLDDYQETDDECND